MNTGSTSLVRAVSSTLGQDLRNFASWDPMSNKLQCAMRDGTFLILDIPKFFKYTNSNYGAMRRYIRQARVNKGRINPEDFKDVDTNVLRESMIRHNQFKGPLQKIDFRIFYWIYGVMFVYICWQAYGLQKMLDAKIDKSGSSLEQRRSQFDDDYMEDVRPR